MKPIVVIAVAALVAVGCAGTQLEALDPVTYVEGVYCPDQNGHAGKDYPWTRLVGGNVCCSWQGMGAGQCPENTSCMNIDSCSTPLPPNDAYGARRVTKRHGL